MLNQQEKAGRPPAQLARPSTAEYPPRPRRAARRLGTLSPSLGRAGRTADTGRAGPGEVFARDAGLTLHFSSSLPLASATGWTHERL